MDNPKKQFQCTVLIVGAGPVGLTAAMALSQKNIDVRVIDSGADVERRMRASTFHPPTLDMIRSFGVLDDLLARGMKVPVWQMRQHETGASVAFDLNTINDTTQHPFRLQAEQHHYCDLLVAALSDRGVEVAFNSSASAIQQTEQLVRVTLEDGQTLRAEWVIGADGSASTVRNSLALQYGGKTYTHTSVLVTTSFDFGQHLNELSGVNYCWSARGPFSLLGLRQVWRASLYPGVDTLEVAAQEDRVRSWLAYIHPAAADAELLDVSPYKVHERCVDKFRVGRVLLAGDAAHINPPSGGMGMNGGIHDAVNLAEKLAAVAAGEDTSLLDRYDRQRRHIVSQCVIPQASANRARMATTDIDIQSKRLAEHRAIADDHERCREFLLRTSMISGLREANSID